MRTEMVRRWCRTDNMEYKANTTFNHIWLSLSSSQVLYNLLRSQTKLFLSPTLIDMAEDHQQTAKESKGIFNRLKKAIQPRTPEEVKAAKLRAKYKRFRILVIGRANAGKTTLLKRVCNTTEEPSIYDKDKNLVSYRLIIAISRSHRFFIKSSNRPPRYRLVDFCADLRLDNWFWHCSGGSMTFVVHLPSRATRGSSSMTLLASSLEARRNLRLWWLSFKSARSPRKLMIRSMSSGTFLFHSLT